MRRKVLLLVEDDPGRAREIQACIPQELHCVWVKSAGAALGVLKCDKYSGIMLDFDLYRSTLGDPQFTGETVAEVICETQQRDCAILVHSQNPSGGRRIFSLLSQSGFSVDHAPWCPEAKDKIREWARELLESE